ncbi:hypothetical protein [Nocardia sp. NBC_01388]|uniref:hypothetical protein n=1 Tax=Nocardia sp. NBC_01388 TaxID=2903596 RepID=UPI00324F7306
MRTNLMARATAVSAAIASALLLAGSIDTLAAPAARADALTCFVDVQQVERGASEVHFGYKAHCTIVSDTIHTETRLWRADTPDPKAKVEQRGATRSDDFLLQQDVEASYTEPCKAGAPTSYFHAEVTFKATKGFAKDQQTVIHTESPDPISC